MTSGGRQRPGWSRWVVAGGLATALGAGLLALTGGEEGPAGPGPAPSARPRGVAAPAPAPRAPLPPRIVRLTASPLDVPIGGRVALACEVEGGDASARRYGWVASRGHLEDGEGAEAIWVAPKTPGLYQVGVFVEEGEARVQRTVQLHVHLPSAEDFQALLRNGGWKQAQERARVEQAEVETRLASLREVVAKRETREERLRAFFALEDMAARLLGEGRHEEALRAYEELLGSLLETDPKRRRFQAGRASALFALGQEEEALAAYAEAGDYNHPLSFYYAGLLLEARGLTDEALEAYRKASEANRWFADPLLRYARLLLLSGHPAHEVIELLVTASPRFGRDVLLDRLGADAQLAQLQQALTASGRAVELEEQRPLETSLPEPPAPPAPGRNSVVIRDE